MIEQITYRKEENEYVMHCSKNVKKSASDEIIGIMNKLHYTEDEIFVIPSKEVTYYCKGLKDGFHALVIDSKEYKEKTRNPEEIFGLTNQNFSHLFINDEGQYLGFNLTDVIDSFNITDILRKYQLMNDDFMDFINVIYTAVLKNENKSIGIYCNENTLEVFDEFGYVILSLLPYEVRNRIGFINGFIKADIFTVHLLKDSDDTGKVNAYYDVNLHEFVNTDSLGKEDFAMETVMNNNEDSLNTYFNDMSNYINGLGTVTGKYPDYISVKMYLLSKNPDIIKDDSEESRAQLIEDILSYKYSNGSDAKVLAAKIMTYTTVPYTAFKQNYDLLAKLSPSNQIDVRLSNIVSKNMISSFSKCEEDDKVKIFKELLQSKDTKVLNDVLTNTDTSFYNKTKEDLINLYISTKENSELYNTLSSKIYYGFKASDADSKSEVLSMIFALPKSNASNALLYNLLTIDDPEFFASKLNILADLYAIYYKEDSKLSKLAFRRIEESNITSDQAKELADRLLDKENTLANDELLLVMFKNMDMSVYDGNRDFLDKMSKKYDVTEKQELKDIYVQFLLKADTPTMEAKLATLKSSKADDIELMKKIYAVIEERNDKVSIASVKNLIDALYGEEYYESLTTYVRNQYLMEDNDESMNIYNFLENECADMYESTLLNKEELISYDGYYATKISDEQVDTLEHFLQTRKIIAQHTYQDKSIAKLEEHYINYQKRMMQSFYTDRNRYDYYQAMEKTLIDTEEIETNYVSQVCEELVKSFWSIASYDTFDFRNMDVYLMMNIDHQYDNHCNVQLTQAFTTFFSGESIVWSDVYKYFVGHQIIQLAEQREHIIKGFIYLYDEVNHYDVDNPNFIALKYIDYDHDRMFYDEWFTELSSKQLSIDEDAILAHMVWKYLDPGAKKKAKKELALFKKYNEPYPTYSDIHNYAMLGSIIGTVLTIINHVFYSKNLVITSNIRGTYLLLNYIAGMVIVIGASAGIVMLVQRVMKRKSKHFKNYVYIDLAVTYGLLVCTVILNLLIKSTILAAIASVVLMVIAVFLNIQIAQMNKDAVTSKHLKEIQGGVEHDVL